MVCGPGQCEWQEQAAGRGQNWELQFHPDPQLVEVGPCTSARPGPDTLLQAWRGGALHAVPQSCARCMILLMHALYCMHALCSLHKSVIVVHSGWRHCCEGL